MSSTSGARPPSSTMAASTGARPSPVLLAVTSWHRSTHATSLSADEVALRKVATMERTRRAADAVATTERKLVPRPAGAEVGRAEPDELAAVAHC